MLLVDTPFYPLVRRLGQQQRSPPESWPAAVRWRVRHTERVCNHRKLSVPVSGEAGGPADDPGNGTGAGAGGVGDNIRRRWRRARAGPSAPDGRDRNVAPRAVSRRDDRARPWWSYKQWLAVVIPPCRGTGHHAFRAVGAAIATVAAATAVLPQNPQRDTATVVVVVVVIISRRWSSSSPPPLPSPTPAPSPADVHRRRRRRHLVLPPCGWCRALRVDASPRTRNPPRPLAARDCCTTASRPTSSRSASCRRTPLRHKWRMALVWSRPTGPG